MQDKFQSIIEKYHAQIEQDSKTFNTLGFAKLAVVVALVVCIVFLFAGGGVIWAVFTVVLAVTAILWVWHFRLDNKIRYAKGIVKICNEHLDRITGEWTKFEDTGREFIDFEHPYACDLDIVGPKSFFQFLNTTHTWHGRQAFAGDLLGPAYNIADVQERQKAITELSHDIHFTNDIQFFLSQIGAKAQDAELVKELSDDSSFIGGANIWRLLLSYLPVISVILLLAGVIFQMPPMYLTGSGFVIVQMVLCKISGGNAAKYLGIMNRMPYKLDKYVRVIDTITVKDFSSAKLNQIKSQLMMASKAVKELEKIDNKLSIRANPLIYVVFNMLLLWDFHCAFLLERWKGKYSHLAAQWFTAIGEFESLVSFSHLPKVCNNVCLPDICEDGKIFTKNLGHPLLQNGSRVNNDVQFNNNIFIISGSNMSGKTTFMRTVGVNLLLARVGSFVCAREMMCTRFDIITSMRIADDLNEGVSTFYAELRRVKQIIDRAENPNMLFLIDEIFKGTNSVDRLAGADAVISKLSELNAMGMVSTHDLELCKLADLHVRIENHSFSEYYENGNIYFDYKIRHRQSKTTNAKFLMEMVGI